MENILNYASQTSSFALTLVIVLSVLIFFHELGHFLFARIFGVGVEKFSLGFGPRILGKTIGRTDYRVSLFPLGGYVKLVGEDPDDEVPPEDEPYSFANKSVYQKMMVVAAGPAFNVVLAWILFIFISFMTGIPTQLPKIIGVGEDSPAKQSGLLSGDLVVAVNNEVVDTWQDMASLISDSSGKTVKLTVKRQDELIDFKITPRAYKDKNVFGESVDRYMIGISSVKISLTNETLNEMLDANISDEIIQSAAVLSDKKFITAKKFNDDLKAAIGEEAFELHKDFIWKHLYIDKLEHDVKQLNPIQAIIEGTNHTGRMVQLTLLGLWKFITGALGADTIGGPIAIAQMADQSAKAGWLNLIFFIAIISINLALVNLLPIPVLDGGHLMFFGFEAISKRPVNLRAREIAQQIGIVFLVTVMIAVTYNDIIRSFFS
ncbi:RIP metalloprotease RseP [Candidatus Magnetomorum sp. HK-1]|nr:RIP metalloprotease RseP [Candidatus Magnetomorum sp. HK-1]